MRLDSTTLVEVIKHTPLVSIDIIVRNQDKKVFLGLRNNEPAKNWWFVPGGRILVNERIENAFLRITYEELGKTFPIESATHKGVFEHFYDRNFAEQPGFGTHYIVLAYEILLEEELKNLPQEQHYRYKWFSVNSLLNEKRVHPHTKAYFSPHKLEK